MRLFHVSEESNITVFHPRLPERVDLDQTKGLVWAINETCLPNFLTPRDCPRVTYYCGEQTTVEDKKRFLSSLTTRHVVAIEHNWFDRMKNTTLYLYEFNSAEFYLQDENAGYYVSEKSQVPIIKHVLTDLFHELITRRVEVRLVDNLWDLCDEVSKSSFHWSMCRMRNAEKR